MTNRKTKTFPQIGRFIAPIIILLTTVLIMGCSSTIEFELTETPAVRTENVLTQTPQTESERTELIEVTEPADSITQAKELFSQGETYLENGEFDQAIDLFTQAIQLNPEHFESYFGRGIAYQKTEAFELAILDFTRAAELNPEEADRYFLNRAIAYVEFGKPEPAIADYTRVIEINPENVLGYVNLAAEYIKRGAFDLAIANLDRAIEINPEFPAAYSNRASAYLATEALELAIADYTTLINDLDQKDKEAYRNRGVAYSKIGEFELAIADYSKTIELDSAYAAAYYNRASAYEQIGENDLAMDDQNKAIELDPNDPVAYNNRGYAFERLGEHELAMADYDQALELDPTYLFALNNRGRLHLINQNFDLALMDFNRVIEMHPNSPGAYYSRGYIYSWMDEADLAVIDLQKYLELAPDAPERAELEAYIKAHGPQKDPLETIEWIEIPAGSFSMGGSPLDAFAKTEELPLHQVDIPYTYWIARHETTNAQYKAFLDDNNADRAPNTSCDVSDIWYRDGSHHPQTADYPVTCISYANAVAYTQWLGDQLELDNGYAILLPSEAEWEKAARGSEDERIYPWGNEFDGLRLNCGQACQTGLGGIIPVGSFPDGRSPYGVDDMAGNVSEWTRTANLEYPYTRTDGRDQLPFADLPEGGVDIIYRGGDYASSPDEVRVSSRYSMNISSNITFTSSSIGFRVVIVAIEDVK